MKTKNLIIFTAALILSVFQMGAQADTPVPDISVASTVLDSIKAITDTSIMPMALKWLGAFFTLQIVITNFGLLKSGADLEGVLLKLGGSVVWLVVCVYILNNGPELIDKIGTGAMTTFASSMPTFGAVVTSTIIICTGITAGIAAVGAPVVGFPGLANVLVGFLFAVFSAGMYLAVKIFMLQIELGLVIMLSPLSFSLLGLNALRDQGIAPFKSILSLVYRIILIGVIASAFGHVMDVMAANMDKFHWTNLLDWGNKINAILSGLVAFPVLVYLLWKSDSIAASLASGTTNMAPSDIGSAVAAGVSGGMAVAAASQAATASTSSMGDFMKKMMGGGGMSSTSGANGSGPGGGTIPEPPPALSSLSSPSGQPPMSLDDVRKSEQAFAAGGSPAGVDVGGGSSGGAAAAPFSKADGAAAASAVPANANQNTKNAAAVGAAMRASGAPESMAALAENIVADGGSAQGVANACGTTPAQNAAVDNALVGASDPAWLNSGSATSPGGSGANAAIGGNTQSNASPNHLADMGKHLNNLQQHGKEDKAHVQVSINANAE